MSGTHAASQSTPFKVWSLLTGSEKRRAAGLLAMMIVGMVMEALGIGLIIPALALLTQPDYADRFPVIRRMTNFLGNPGQKSLVIGGMLVLVSVYLVKTLFLALLAWRQTRFAYDVQAGLSQRLFSLYLRQAYTFHLQRNSAQLIRNSINEVQQFTGQAMIPGMQLLTEGLVLLGLFALLCAVEPVGALLVVGVLVSASWGFHHLTRKRILRWGKERLRNDGLRFQHLQQGLGGVKDVKILGREKEFLDQYAIHNRQSARAGFLQKTLQQLPRLWLEFLAILGLAGLVIAILAQGRAIEAVLPTLGVFAAAAFRTLPSVNRLISSIQSVRYAKPVIDVLHHELEIEVQEQAPDRRDLPSIRDRLTATDISFRYANAAHPALDGLSLVIGQGETVGLIGPSGAGKSTLVDILLGLLQPGSGTVSVDGVDIQLALRGWQDQIGYVSQSIFLTDDTLRRNVAFGLPEAEIDDAAVQRALHAAQLSEFVATLPEGVQTLVGERGVRLSGGQRQRIGIARALYHDPEVLVLDEATSSLDTATERGVMGSVQALHGRKTIIIVAHRLSTVANCDRIYRLAGGKVVQEGVPGVVLAENEHE